MRLLLPIALALVGLAAGIAAGLYLHPAPDPSAEAAQAPDVAEAASVEYARLANQFVIPVVTGERVGALVVLTLSLEVSEGETEAVFAQEPRLRDVFLQALFDHANTGGFGPGFTQSGNLAALRQALRDAARTVLGDILHDVLIVDIVRQET